MWRLDNNKHTNISIWSLVTPYCCFALLGKGKPAENLEMPFHVSLPWELIQIQLHDSNSTRYIVGDSSKSNREQNRGKKWFIHPPRGDPETRQYVINRLFWLNNMNCRYVWIQETVSNWFIFGGSAHEIKKSNKMQT